MIEAREGQRVRITWNFPVRFGRYANAILWSAVEGTMGTDGVIHNLTAYGMDLEYPKDTVIFAPENYEIIESELGFADLLHSMRGGEIAVLHWADSKAVIEKYSDGVWVFPGSEKEFTSEEIVKFRGLVRIDNLDCLL